jgi:hypothetical protein
MGQPLLVLLVTLTALVGCDSDSDPTPSERNSVDSRQIGGREPCRVAVTQGDDVQSAGLRRPSATVTVVPGPVSVGFRGGCPDDVTGYFVTRSGRALESSEGIKPRPSSHPARSGVATMCSDRARLVEDRLPSDSIPFDSQPDHPPAHWAKVFSSVAVVGHVVVSVAGGRRRIPGSRRVIAAHARPREVLQ